MQSKIVYQKCEKCGDNVPTIYLRNLKVLELQFELCEDCLQDWNSWARFVSDKKRGVLHES